MAETTPANTMRCIIDHRNNAVPREGFSEEPPIVGKVHHGEVGRGAPLFHPSKKLARHMPGIHAMQCGMHPKLMMDEPRRPNHRDSGLYFHCRWQSAYPRVIRTLNEQHAMSGIPQQTGNLMANTGRLRPARVCH
jgi:hypothetical protein